VVGGGDEEEPAPRAVLYTGGQKRGEGFQDAPRVLLVEG